jgi:hypothetical protein
MPDCGRYRVRDTKSLQMEGEFGADPLKAEAATWPSAMIRSP